MEGKGFDFDAALVRRINSIGVIIIILPPISLPEDPCYDNSCISVSPGLPKTSRLLKIVHSNKVGILVGELEFWLQLCLPGFYSSCLYICIEADK